MIAAETVSMRLGTRAVLKNVSLSLQPGDFAGLAGPNGAGKSSLLRGLAGLVPVESGRVEIDGFDIAGMTPGERAKRIAWLGQSRPVAWDMLVEDIAALGRYGVSAASYSRSLAPQKAAIDLALAKAGASDLCGRSFKALSGGEQARVHIARLLASPAPYLLLDEPCAALDIVHQLNLMATLRDEAATGRGVLIVLHDLALIARHCRRAILLNNGHLVADGPTASVLDGLRLASIFGVKRAPDGGLERV